jgi:hypothetical protein
MTYGEQRTPLQEAIDEVVLEKVKRGIAVLEEKYGPDWVDRIDLDTLDLGESDSCVLGQVYAGAELSDAEWEWFHSYLEDHDSFYSNWGVAEVKSSYEYSDGYMLGKIALDGDVLERPQDYGFESSPGANYDELQAAWEHEIIARRPLP